MSSVASERKIRRFEEEPLRPGDLRTRPKGSLLIIGGHEDKEGDSVILRTLAKKVGAGKLVVATLASESPGEMWETYEPLMRRLGVRHVHHLQIERREDGSSVRAMTTLDDATAVFFTGGDQVRITSLMGDTPVFSRIVEIFASGGTIAGTSAGASVLSETMMVGGSGEKSYQLDANLRLAPGFGFVRGLVIDQHFAERGRIGRLLAVVGQNPRVLGVGIDEDTAVELRPGISFRVLGSGGVTVLDGSTIRDSNLAEEASERTISIVGATLHALSAGDEFDIERRSVVLGEAEDTERAVGLHSGKSKRAAE
jgi:cyanophycinase